ncbi:T9SS type A sorting domain-containing protein, partial [bacterium]|nr:T9SS type A sorting domain-containing protein [bacterium]
SPRPLTQPPIYGYLLSHNEEPPLNPRYFEDSVVFFYNRMELLYLANRLFDAGVKLCWQSEWNFAKAVPLYDHGDGTAGMNIVQYMHDSLGFEIDPHAHESVYNYADVAYFIQQCGVTPSGVVGGFVAYPETACIVEHFFAPIEADSFPGYVWTPQILSAPGTRDHIDEDSLWISGVWKPPDAEHFLEHSDTAPLPCVGKYLSNWEGFWDIISRAESGELDPNKLYTAGIFIAQGGLSHAGTDALIAELDDLQEYTNTDRIRWTTIEEIVQIWRTVYDSVPNMLWYGVPASDVEQNPGPGQPNQIEIAVRPNPFNSACVITAPAGTDISIYDLSGRSVFRRPTRIALGNGWESFLWVPAPSLPSGIYVIRGIQRDGTVSSRRVLLIR